MDTISGAGSNLHFIEVRVAESLNIYLGGGGGGRG